LLLPCIQIDSASNTRIGSRDFPLPAALLVHVLSYLPLSQRLGRAALVCRAWRAAADAASTSISHSFKWYDPDAGAAESASITAWLGRGAAQHITALALDGLLEQDDEDSPRDLCLPMQQLSQLRSLQMSSIDLLRDQPLGGSSSSSCSGDMAGPFAAMGSSLTFLELYDMTFHGYNMQQLFHSMASLSQLQRLELTSVRVEPQDGAGWKALEMGTVGQTYSVADVLRRMPHLTYLHLDEQTECQLQWAHSPAAIGTAVAGLHHLQHLDLCGLELPEGAPHTMFRRLPASITKLHVSMSCVTIRNAICDQLGIVCVK
jgi:hypothetical protein